MLRESGLYGRAFHSTIPAVQYEPLSNEDNNQKPARSEPPQGSKEITRFPKQVSPVGGIDQSS